MKTSEILFKAAQIIERDGLHKGCYESGGSVCVMGAMNKAASGNPRHGESAGSADIFFRKFTGLFMLTDWNDDPKTTAEEVIDMLVIASIEAES